MSGVGSRGGGLIVNDAPVTGTLPAANVELEFKPELELEDWDDVKLLVVVVVNDDDDDDDELSIESLLSEKL